MKAKFPSILEIEMPRTYIRHSYVISREELSPTISSENKPA